MCPKDGGLFLPAGVESAQVPLFSLLRAKVGQCLPLLILAPVLIYLVVVPLALLLLSSFRPEGLPLNSGFTLANYVDAYLGPDFLPLLKNTVFFAIGATVTALTLGSVMAWLTERTDLPARGTVRA